MDMLSSYHPAHGQIRRRAVKERYRVTLHEGAIAKVEDGYIPPNGTYPAEQETTCQLALIYRGAFSYRVGARKWVLDANNSLFIAAGWETQEEQLLPEVGHAAVIVTPSPESLEEICTVHGGSAELIITFALSLGLAWLSYVTVESWARRLRGPHKLTGSSTVEAAA